VLGAAARAAVRAGADVTVLHAAWRDEEEVVDGVRFRFVAEPPAIPGAVSRRIPRRLAASVAPRLDTRSKAMPTLPPGACWRFTTGSPARGTGDDLSFGSAHAAVTPARCALDCPP
jgi:hypothetical protein